MQLKRLIDKSGTHEITAQESCAGSVFVEAALRAARNSKSSIRVNILKDISIVLGCEVRDLGFLFEQISNHNNHNNHNNDNDSKLEVPDMRFHVRELSSIPAE